MADNDKIDLIYDMLVKQHIPERVAALEKQAEGHTWSIRYIWGAIITSLGMMVLWLLDTLKGVSK